MTTEWRVSQVQDIDKVLKCQKIPELISRPFASAKRDNKTQMDVSKQGGSIGCRTALADLSDLAFPAVPNQGSKSEFLATTSSLLDVDPRAAGNFEAVLECTYQPTATKPPRTYIILQLLGGLRPTWLAEIAVYTRDRKYIVFPRNLVRNQLDAGPPLVYQSARDPRFLYFHIGPAQTRREKDHPPPAPASRFWPLREPDKTYVDALDAARRAAVEAKQPSFSPPPLDDAAYRRAHPTMFPEQAILDAWQCRLTATKDQKVVSPPLPPLTNHHDRHDPLELFRVATHRVALFAYLCKTFDRTRLAATPLFDRVVVFETLARKLYAPPHAVGPDPSEAARACLVLVRGWWKFDRTTNGQMDSNFELWRTLERLLARAVRRLTGPAAWLKAWSAQIYDSRPATWPAPPKVQPRVPDDEARERRFKKMRTASPSLPSSPGLSLPESNDACVAVTTTDAQWREWHCDAPTLDRVSVQVVTGEPAEDDAETRVFSLDGWWEFVEDTVPRELQHVIDSAFSDSDGDRRLDQLFKFWQESFPKKMQRAERHWRQCIQQCEALQSILIDGG